ncbi:Bodo-specific multi-copy gene family, putative [Bodo saltans]|uniref:Bodo-specific multi-copy gene family, putative n=1 Tax=Bodo saltans TaxID=75058 RepID=A0A0S4J4Y7_BODSA|nr:Bodo-specific multi-copy gene family, putative [Bodo saltans]|eukprot:CUG81156.1 Bodo-specific multi-copy gene family, putative [Bodo saltans]
MDEEKTLEGLCELIRGHVATVTGRPQAPANYSTAEAAYKMMEDETKLYFRIPDDAKDVYPLIVLDTCEVLAELHHAFNKHKSGIPHTLLESFCSKVPSPRCIVAICCNAKFEQDELTASHAHLISIGPLQPLSAEGHHKAITKSWGVEGIDPHVRTIVHQLSGGVPRLLRAAHQFPATVTFAYGSFNALPHCFESYSKYAAEQYSIEGKWTFLAYTCLLASSTKAIVLGDHPIPLNPAWKKAWKETEWGKQTASGEDPPLPTFKDASLASIGTYIPGSSNFYEVSEHFIVPPITFLDEHAKPGAPIMPSDLHPFLSIDVIKHLGSWSDLDRGRLFEKAIHVRCVRALFAGVLEEHQEVHPDQVHILERYEANLSGGLVTDVAEGLYEHAARRAPGIDLPPRRVHLVPGNWEHGHERGICGAAATAAWKAK